MAEECYHSIIEHILARYEEHGTAIYNSRTGHSRAQSTLKAVSGTRKLLNDCAAREGMAETKVTLQCLKQQILGIKIYHKKTVPNSCGNQAQRAKTAWPKNLEKSTSSVRRKTCPMVHKLDQSSSFGRCLRRHVRLENPNQYHYSCSNKYGKICP